MENNKEIASEMHRWGRMTGAFSIIAMVTWLVLDAIEVFSARVNPAFTA